MISADFVDQCKKMLDFGWTVAAIAKEVKLDEPSVEAVLAIHELPTQVHRYVDAGVLDIQHVFDAVKTTATILAAMQVLQPFLQVAKATLATHRRCAVIIDDCRNYLKRQPENSYEAIIADPPYEIGLHSCAWDNTGVSLSPELWNQLFRVLKPGGFVAVFTASRLYHRVAVTVENAGFKLYPLMTWQIAGALPKPANVSELFDRDNASGQRDIVGYRSGSGFTRANVRHGAQNRTSNVFPLYARHVSQEAQDWRGHYYGVTCLAPTIEPILLAQKPIDGQRTIDNIRRWRTGSLNIGALQKRYDGAWPGLSFVHQRDNRFENLVGHLCVKPVSLMEDLCLLLCPPKGRVLDPFAGTGTTGVAALRAGFSCSLVEKDPKLRSIIERRVSLNSCMPMAD